MCSLSVKLPATVWRSHSHFCLCGISLQLHLLRSEQGTTIGPASCHSMCGVKKKCHWLHTRCTKLSLTTPSQQGLIAEHPAVAGHILALRSRRRQKYIDSNLAVLVEDRNTLVSFCALDSWACFSLFILQMLANLRVTNIPTQLTNPCFQWQMRHLLALWAYQRLQAAALQVQPNGM